MDKSNFILQVGQQLEKLHIPYKIGTISDIEISASFKTSKEADADEKKGSSIVYFAVLLLDLERNRTVFFERGTLDEAVISEDENLSNIMIKTEDDDSSAIAIGAISKALESVALSCGLSFEKTIDEKTASFRQSIATAPLSTQGEDYAQASLQTEQTNKDIKKKKSFLLIAIIICVAVITIIAVAASLGKNSENKEPSLVNDTTAGDTDFAVVSSGVSKFDLGNITNGQYYFATDEMIFYSSYDVNDKAHIYSANKDGSGSKPIFDGFGWSLVVIDDWLYFSGNRGDAIDGTYTIFRMRFDGSQVENINNEYSYGMFLYGEYLYYMKKSDTSSDSMSICRASLDGTNEQILVPAGRSPLIYENKLYYFDNQGNMYKTNPDATEPEVLLSAAVKTYVLSDGKIIYNDFNDNIYTCDLSGENNKLIKSSSGTPIHCVNAYQGMIFYAQYDTNFDYTAYGYNYTIKRCGMDGSDEKSVFSSVSYGIYINLVNDRLMLMDYAKSSASSIMSASIKTMSLDGVNADTIAR